MLLRFSAFLVASLAAAVALMAVVDPVPAQAEPPPGNWALTFNEEFSANGLNTALWTPEWPSGPMSGECTSPGLVSQPGNGYLYLQVRAQKSTCGGVEHADTGSLVESNPADGKPGHSGFLYSYGYVEWHVYIVGWGGEAQGCPKGGCIPDWPALWSFPENEETEIDTMEGLKGQACYHFWRHLEPAYQVGGCAAGSYAGWHTYGVDWEPGSLKYYYDGTKVWEYNSGDIKSTPQYLIMDEVPPGSYGGELVVPDEIVVDYVRVWQHPGPEVYSQTPRNITRQTAELASQVRPGSYEASYFFEYGTTTGYGSRVPASSEEHLPPSENWAQLYIPVTGLTSCTTYDYRIVAKNVFGTSYGPNEELTTECWPPKATTEAVQGVKGTSAELKGEVYPNGLKTEYWFEYGKEGSFESKTTVTEAGSNHEWHAEHATVTLEPCVEYQFRVVAENEDSRNEHSPGGVVDGETMYFKTKCKPVVTPEAATNITSKKATLNATVNPEGTPAEYYFEYGKVGEGLAHKVPASAEGIGSGTEGVKVKQTITGLTPGESYESCVIAANEVGETKSCSAVFKTLKPTATTEPASNIISTEAVLNGTVNPAGEDTHYHFEYGPTEAYGHSTPTEDIGAGTSNVKVMHTLGHLAAATKYYYRVVATSDEHTLEEYVVPPGGNEPFSTTSVSAHKIHYCHKTGLEEGAFKESKCGETGGTAEYVSGVPGSSGALLACLKDGSGKGLFGNSACSESGGSQSWEERELVWPQKLVGQSGTVVLKSKLAGAGAEISCTTGKFESQRSADAEAEGQIELSSCTVNKPGKCTVKQPITLGFIGEVEESSGKLVDKLTGSGTGETFAKMTFEGGAGCSVNGETWPLTGTETCEFDSNIAKYQEEHEVICGASGSKLKLGSESATYEGGTTWVEAGGVTGGEAWSSVAWPSKLEGSSGTVTLKSKLAGAGAEIVCTQGRFETQRRKEPEWVGEMELSSCTVVKPGKCTVKEPIVVAFISQMEESSGKLVDKLTGSGTGETFAKMTFEGGAGCSVNGDTVPLTGTQTCEFDTNIGKAEEKHELICGTSGSKLKLGSESATYEDTTTIESRGGEAWAAVTWPSKLEGSSGTVVLKSKLAGANAEISCTKGKFEAQPEEEGESAEGKIELSSCTVNKPGKCTVKQPIVAQFTGQLEEGSGKLVDKLTGSGTGETFAKMTFEGGTGCSVNGDTVPLTGTQTFEWDANIGTYQEKHELIGTTSGSKLKLGSESATYEGTTTITAAGGVPWTAH